MSPKEKFEILKSCSEAIEKNLSIKEFADAIGVSERTLYYWRKPRAESSSELRRPPPNKLSSLERKSVVQVLHRQQWASLSPREIYYKLLDEEEIILASISTFYRIARKEELLPGRSKMNHSGLKLNRPVPHLIAKGSNEVWSWDVTQIASTARTIRYYLYVIIDIWSRYVVGWALEDHEKTEPAIAMWKQALEDQAISGKNLTNHKDNGSIMISTEMIKFVRDAEMINSYSRAGVSDDNPFSESLFRSIKYFRDFPERFENIETGRSYFQQYFSSYNDEFRHSGIQFLSPADRHFGEELKILNDRNEIIEKFYLQNKRRYSGKPKTFFPILEVKIN